jgi:hypothetical protein
MDVRDIALSREITYEANFRPDDPFNERAVVLLVASAAVLSHP